MGGGAGVGGGEEGHGGGGGGGVPAVTAGAASGSCCLRPCSSTHFSWHFVRLLYLKHDTYGTCGQLAISVECPANWYSYLKAVHTLKLTQN